MAFNHELTVFQSFKVSAPIEDVAQYVSSANHMQTCMPKLDQFDEIGENAFYVKFLPLGPEGYKFPFDFKVRLECEGEHIHYVPVNDKETNTVLSGKWSLQQKGDDTFVSMSMDVNLHVPVSRILKAVAGPVIAKVFNKIMEKYIQNISMQFA